MGGKYSSLDPMDVEVPNIQDLLNRDHYLKPYEKEIRRRYENASFHSSARFSAPLSAALGPIRGAGFLKVSLRSARISMADRKYREFYIL